ncbi:RNA-binding RNA processing protein rpp1 [Sporothrix bragantina]|uniref:RNA-binding RNA processing protein rpp1 n=1 Tax=Sporothrix bragantina TaxID=671064 RepID=A0ABP0C839_9PEZI
MLHDLSLVWTPSTTPVELANTLALSAELGYDVVALDHLYQGAVPSTIASPLGDAITAASSTLTSSRRSPKILHRATVVISDLTVNHRLGAIASAYDLVAVRPTTEKAFQAACLSMAEPSLISLDLTTYFPFYFKHRACMAAVRRGVHFEVCYGQALRAGDSSTAADAKSGSAARARALFIANLAGLMRATRGRGIVVSSGARAALDLRGPADVVNLLAVWGLAPDRGTEGMSALPRSIVANESLRRRGFRGVVDIVQTAGGADGEKQQPKAGDGKQQKQKQQQQKQNQQQKQQKTNDQRKRKADDGLGNGPQAKHQQMKKQKKGGV